MRMRRIGSVTTIGLVGLWFAWAEGAPAQHPAPNANTAARDDVASIGSYRVTRAEFDKRWADAERIYRQRVGVDVPREYRPTARRQVLEIVIRQRLVMFEAQRLGLGGTAVEAEAILKQDARFNPNGQFDEALWRAARDGSPVEYQRALQDIQSTLGARKLGAQYERESVPAAGEVEKSTQRRMTDATIDVLPLRRGEFDGGYPEPTEAAVLSEYRKRANEHQVPAAAHFTALRVNTPELADSLAIRVDARRAWDQRMQQRADSALSAVKRGATLEQLAPAFGGVEHFAVSQGGRFPAWWRGDADDEEQVLALAPHRVGPRAYPLEPGRVLIRLDERLPVRPASLQDVAVELRSRLRRDARAYRDDREIATLYAAVRDSLAGPASAVRYAVADTSTFPIAQPSDEQLRVLYKERLSDFTQLDEGSGQVVTSTYAEAKPFIYQYWVSTRRSEALYAAANRLVAVWANGRRDAAAEKAMTAVHDVGMVPHAGQVDTSLAGIRLSDSLKVDDWTPGVRIVRFPRGLVVAQVSAPTPDFKPSLAQARPMLERRLERMHDDAIERGAEQLYARDPERFRVGRTWYFTRLIVPVPDPLAVPLTRTEVERAYDQHISEYGSPEMVHVRHLLISPSDPTPAADAAARARAESLLVRARAGEDFARLAQRYSDDPATRDNGGDVGAFGRGSMLPEFENAAFRLRPGDVSDLVHTEVGYHILRGVEYFPAEIVPLVYTYSSVASELADRRAEALGRTRADSLRRSFRTPAQARAAARKLGYGMLSNDHSVGERTLKELSGYFKTLETLRPGEFHPDVQLYRGLGYAITWMDSVVASRMPTWPEARNRARETWQVDASQRAMLLKRAELDSMGRAGWSFDSLATLFGGAERRELDGPGTALRQLGGAAIVDSLVFGVGEHEPALAVGEASPWLTFPGGEVRIELVARREPKASQFARRLQIDTQAETERRVGLRYDELRKRYPVAILDTDLAAVPLPQTPKP